MAKTKTKTEGKNLIALNKDKSDRELTIELIEAMGYTVEQNENGYAVAKDFPPVSLGWNRESTFSLRIRGKLKTLTLAVLNAASHTGVNRFVRIKDGVIDADAVKTKIDELVEIRKASEIAREKKLDHDQQRMKKQQQAIEKFQSLGYPGPSIVINTGDSYIKAGIESSEDTFKVTVDGLTPEQADRVIKAIQQAIKGE